MSILTSVKNNVNTTTSSVKTLDCFGANYELVYFTHHLGSINCAMKESVCQYSQIIKLPSEFYKTETFGNTTKRHYLTFISDYQPLYYNGILNLIYVSKLGDKDPNEHFNMVLKDFKATSTTVFAKKCGDQYGNYDGDMIIVEIGHHQPRYHCTLVFRPIETRFVTQI